MTSKALLLLFFMVQLGQPLCGLPLERRDGEICLLTIMQSC